MSATYQDWESVDPATLDVEDVLRRWEMLRKNNFKAGSLNAYKSRFRKAIEDYSKWYENPSGWRPEIKTRNRTPKARTDGTAAATPPSRSRPRPRTIVAASPRPRT